MLLIFVKVAKPKQPNLQTILRSCYVFSSNLLYAKIFQSCHMFFFKLIYAKQVCKILFKVVRCISQTCYMYLSKLSHAFLALCQTKPAEVWPRFWSVLKLLLCCWMNLVVKFTNFVSCTAIYDLFQMPVRALNAWVRSVFGNVE